MKCESIFKISEGRPNPSDYLKNGEITMMMITSSGDEPDLRDGKDLRRLALTLQVGGRVDGVLLRMSLVYLISP